MLFTSAWSDSGFRLEACAGISVLLAILLSSSGGNSGQWPVHRHGGRGSPPSNDPVREIVDDSTDLG
jgi:hypothetical protein